MGQEVNQTVEWNSIPGSCYSELSNVCDSLTHNGSIQIDPNSINNPTLYPYNITLDGQFYDEIWNWGSENELFSLFEIPNLDSGTLYSLSIVDGEGCTLNLPEFIEVEIASELNIEIVSFCPECQESSNGGFAYNLLPINNIDVSSSNYDLDIFYSNNYIDDCLFDYNNDGVLDLQQDLDNDEIFDFEDDDIDGDGLEFDMDGDGIDNFEDDDIDGDGIDNFDTDIDGDNVLNFEDDDIDGDGIFDEIGNCISNCNDGAEYDESGNCISDCFNNDITPYGSINSDEDSDGVLNFDSDIFDFDNDGILNDNDISPYDNDIDNDGIIDGLDDDISGIPYDHIFDISLNSDFNFVSLNNSIDDEFYFINDDYLNNIPDPNVLPNYHQEYILNLQSSYDQVVGGLNIGNYFITVVDEFGCQYTQEIDISNEFCEPQFGETRWNNCLFIPSVITPNGDGINDLWDIYNIELYEPNASVKLFNRWGQIVYENGSDIYSNKLWDGKNMNGNNVEIATYYYVIEVQVPNSDEMKNYTGYVVVKR